MNEQNSTSNNKDCKPIDIYVFVNGQQYSPPRKYHLNSEELNLWNNTLSNMARSLYGPNTPKVEIYTLEGTKVTSPVELSNSAAYVAVNPPNDFIQAGYNQYLIKASRSREKRQEKILKNEESAANGIAINNNNLVGKSGIPETHNTKNKENNVDTKMTESENNSAVAKDNVLPKSNKTLPKSNTNKHSSKHKCSKDCKLNECQSKYKTLRDMSYVKCINRPVRKPSVSPQSTKSNVARSNLHCASKNRNANSTKKFNKPNLGTNLETIFPNNKTEVNLFQSNPIKENIIEPIVDLNTTTVEKFKDKQDKIVEKLPQDYEKDVALIFNNYSLFKQTKDESTSINKSGLIKLKLNIEVRDYHSKITQSTQDTLHLIQTEVPLISTEQSSQVNIDLDASNVTLVEYKRDNIRQENSLKSVITINEEMVTNNQNTKLIVIHCACDQFDAENRVTQMRCTKLNGNCICVVPNNEKTEESESCKCGENDFTKIENSAVPEKCNVQDKTKECQVFIIPGAILCTSEAPAVQTCCQKENKDGKSCKAQSDVFDQPPNSDKGDDIKAVALTVDQNTQTEWCDVLLEARRQQNGLYSLHLPPLDRLIEYKFL